VAAAKILAVKAGTSIVSPPALSTSAHCHVLCPPLALALVEVDFLQTYMP